MTYSFRWTCSYQNMREYEVYGVAKIEVYRHCDADLEAYQRKTHNGDSASYERNHKSAWGGARVSWDHYSRNNWNRWTPELWESFIAYLRSQHEEHLLQHERLVKQYPEVTFTPIEPFNPPNAIYWDTQDNGWKFDTRALGAPVITQEVA